MTEVRWRVRAGTVDAKDFAYGLVCHSYPKSLASYMKRINDLPGNARISRKEYFNFARMLLAIDDVEVQCFPSYRVPQLPRTPFSASWHQRLQTPPLHRTRSRRFPPPRERSIRSICCTLSRPWRG